MTRLSFVRPVLAAALVSTVVLVTACGATGSVSSGTQASDTAAASSPEVAAARAAFNQAKTLPTEIPQKTPLAAKPAPGKTIFWLDCGSPGCNAIYTAMKDAVATVGWKVERLTFNLADPSTAVQAMRTALQQKPVAVAFSGLPFVVWSSVIPEFQAAGVALIPSSAGDIPTGPAVPGTIYGPADNAKGGTMLGDWFVASSNGSGHALLVNYPDVGSFAPSVDAFKAEAAKCGGCKVTQLDLTLTQLQSGTTPAVVSALQRDPSITHVVPLLGESLQGFPAAASAAGVAGRVKVAGLNPSIEQLQGLKTGEFDGWVQLVSQGIAWTTVDVALRFDQKMTVPAEDGGLAVGLLTADNIGTPSATSSNLPKDLPEQFKKLWLAG